MIRQTFLSFFAFALLLVSAGAQAPRITLSVSQNPFPVGQAVTLQISMENVQVSQIPPIQLPPGITQAGEINRENQFSISNGQQSLRTELFVPVVAAQAGEFIVQSQTFDINGQQVVMQELKLQAVDPANMPAETQDQNALLLQLHLAKTEIYVGEVIPIRATVYVPGRAQLQRIGLIEVEKSSLAIQRFPQGGEQSSEIVGGIRYNTITFRSSLSALKLGQLNVGPAKVELIYLVPMGNGRRNPGAFGFFSNQAEQKQSTINSPAVPINILPLPTEGKPAQFSGAVGTFSISASANATDVTVGDPVPVDLRITGEGNFDLLQSPHLTAPKGWKTFPAKKYTVDTGNTDPNTSDLMNRQIGFSMVLVPETVSTEVPSFEFSFFDPNKKQYQTLRTSPIPIAIKPGAEVPAPVSAANVGESSAGGPPIKPPAPTANIGDIVTVLPATPRWAMLHSPLMRDPRFLTVNGILASGFVFLLLWSARQKLRDQTFSAAEAEWRQALTQANASGLGRAEFYRRAARLLQLSDSGSAEQAVQKIIERYESLNFAGQAPADESLAHQERQEVLGLIKKLTRRVLLLALFCQVPLAAMAQAELTPDERYATAVEALEKKNYAGARQAAEALAKEQHISAEVFQLAGNAAYREGHPGLAAVWYQRAMLFPTPSVELRQNLRHIHEKTDLLLPPRNETLSAFALTFSRTHWGMITSIGGWLAVFSIAFMIIGARGYLTLASILTLVLGLTAVIAGTIGMKCRPTYSQVKDLVFVIGSNARVHTAASVTSRDVITAPTGSVLRRVLDRSTWTYVEVDAPEDEEKLRGWIPTDQLAPFWPYDPKTLP